jgi:hypothetical protein
MSSAFAHLGRLRSLLYHSYLDLTYGFVEQNARRALAGSWKQFTSGQMTTGSNVPVIVSLTSYPPRFPTLALTLKSLLVQETRPRAIVLWVAYDDFELLPLEVLELRQYGLKIEECEDLRSYKKLVPALRQYGDSHIAVCDDDTYYWPTWLSTLVSESGIDTSTVFCLRAHQIKLDPKGNILPYSEWGYECQTNKASSLVFPTGVGGILYPPGLFDKRALDQELFLSLCPSADDIWFFWMASLAGAKFKLLRPAKRYISWAGSQEKGLWQINAHGDKANDHQIAVLIKHFGLPWEGPLRSGEKPAPP